MVTRATGLVTGMDTDKIIGDLMRVERQRRLDPITKDKQYNEWQAEAYQTVNKTTANSITEFKKALGITTTKSSSSYLATPTTNFDWLKTASTSSSDNLSVSAGSTAIDGTYTLKVDQMAENITRTSVSELPKVTVSALEHQFGVENDFSLKLKTNNGTTDNVKTLNFTKDQTIEDVVAAINSDPDLGLEASYDKTTDKFTIKTKSGYSDFEIQEDSEKILTTDKSKFKTNLVLNNEYASLDKTSSTEISPSNLTGQFGIVGDFSFTLKTNKTDDAGKTFTFNEDTKLSEIIETINNADIGVVASYDSNLNRVFFATKNTGEDNYFEVTNDTANFLTGKKETISSSGDIAGTTGQSIQDRFGLVDGDFDAEGNTTLIIKSNDYQDGVGIKINKGDSVVD
jgi:flagellar hook-associated protein 2